MIEVTQIPMLQAEVQEMIWYTEDDVRHFQQVALLEATRLRRLLSIGTDLDNEDLSECMGIEKHLSTTLRREVIARKGAHIDVVLASQNFGGVSYVSSVSKASSHWAYRRSLDLAAIYHKCLISSVGV